MPKNRKSGFEKKLRAVWEHAASLDGSIPANEAARYVPRALGNGPGWQVWDRAGERFLSNQEIRRMSIEELANAKVAAVH